MSRTNVIKPTACPSNDGFNRGGREGGPLHLKTGEICTKMHYFCIKNSTFFGGGGIAPPHTPSSPILNF